MTLSPERKPHGSHGRADRSNGGRFDENPSMDPNYKAANRLPGHSFPLRYPYSKV